MITGYKAKYCTSIANIVIQVDLWCITVKTWYMYLYMFQIVILERTEFNTIISLANKVMKYVYSETTTSMLVTDIEGDMYWWKVRDVGDDLEMLVTVFAIGSRRWNWKFREKHFWNPNPELLLHSSYSLWP